MKLVLLFFLRARGWVEGQGCRRGRDGRSIAQGCGGQRREALAEQARERGDGCKQN